MYLAKISVRRADGTKRYYYVLRHTTWSKKEKRPIQRYLAYIGPKAIITEVKARKIAKKVSVSLDDLKRVRGLKIIKGKGEDNTS